MLSHSNYKCIYLKRLFLILSLFLFCVTLSYASSKDAEKNENKQKEQTTPSDMKVYYLKLYKELEAPFIKYCKSDYDNKNIIPNNKSRFLDKLYLEFGVGYSFIFYSPKSFDRQLSDIKTTSDAKRIGPFNSNLDILYLINDYIIFGPTINYSYDKIDNKYNEYILSTYFLGGVGKLYPNGVNSRGIFIKLGLGIGFASVERNEKYDIVTNTFNSKSSKYYSDVGYGSIISLGYSLKLFEKIQLFWEPEVSFFISQKQNIKFSSNSDNDFTGFYSFQINPICFQMNL